MHSINGNKKKYLKTNNSLGTMQNKSSATFSEKSNMLILEEIHEEIIKHFKEEKLLENFQVKNYLKVISEMRLLSYGHKNMSDKLKSSLTKIYNQNEKSVEKMTSVSEHLTNHSNTFYLELGDTEEVVITKFPFNHSDTETFKSNMLSNKNFIQKTPYNISLEGNNVTTKQQNDEIKGIAITTFPYNHNDTESSESNMLSNKMFFRETPYNTSLENRNIITTKQNDEMKELERTSKSYTSEQTNRNIESIEMYGKTNVGHNSFPIMNIQDRNFENKSSIYSRKTVSDIYPNNMFQNYLEYNKTLSSISKNIETNDTCIIDSSQQELLMVIDKADLETNKENTNFLDTISFSEINTANIIENSQERLPKSHQKSAFNTFNNTCQLTENISLHNSNISDKQNKLRVCTENQNKISKKQHHPSKIQKEQSMSNKPSLKYILEEIDKHNKLKTPLKKYTVIYYLKIILKMKLDTYKQRFQAEKAKAALIKIYHLNINTERSTYLRAINSNVEKLTSRYCHGNISKSNTPIYKTCNEKSPSYNNRNDVIKSVFSEEFNAYLPNTEAPKETLSIASQNYDEKDNCLYNKDKTEVEIKSTNNYFIDDNFQKTQMECESATSSHEGLSLLPVMKNNESKSKKNLYSNGMHEEDITIKNCMCTRTQSHAKLQKNKGPANLSGISRRRNSSNVDYLNELEILIINHLKGDELLEKNQIKKHLKTISEMTLRKYKYKYLAEKMKAALIKIYNINENFEMWRSWKHNTESNISIKTSLKSEEPTIPCNTWNKNGIITTLSNKDCILMSPKLDKSLQAHASENIETGEVQQTDQSNKTKNSTILDERFKSGTGTIIDETTDFVISNETGEILDETLKTEVFANSKKKAAQQIGQSKITEHCTIQEKLDPRNVISDGRQKVNKKECSNNGNSASESVINECSTMRKIVSNERCENSISSTQNLQETFSIHNNDKNMHAQKCANFDGNYYFNADVSIKKYFKRSSFSDDTCLITKTFSELDIKHHEDNTIYISNENDTLNNIPMIINGDKNSSTMSHEISNHLMNDKTMIIEKNDATEIKELIRKIGKLHGYLENTVRDEMVKVSEVIAKGSKTYAQVHKYLEYIENTVEEEIDELIKILQNIVVEGNHIKLERINWLKSKFNNSLHIYQQNYLQDDWIQCYLNILNKKVKTFDDRFRGMSENDNLRDFFQNSMNQIMNEAETNKTSRRLVGIFNDNKEIAKSSINSRITTVVPTLHWSFSKTPWSSKDNFSLDTLNNTPSVSSQNVTKAYDSQKNLSMEMSNTEGNSQNTLTRMTPEKINIGLNNLTTEKAPFQTLNNTRKVSAKYEQVIKTMILAFERAHMGLTMEKKRNNNKPHCQMSSTTQESEKDVKDHQKSPNFNSHVQKHLVSTEKEMKCEMSNQKESTSKENLNYIQPDRQMSSQTDKDQTKSPNFNSNVQKHLASSEREVKCEVNNLTQLLQNISFDGNTPRLKELQTLSTSYEQKYSETDLAQSYSIQLEKLSSHFKTIFLRGNGRQPYNVPTNEESENMFKNWKI